MVRFHLSSCEFALSTPERAPSAYISVAFSACRNGDGHENNAIGGYEFAVQASGSWSFRSTERRIMDFLLLCFGRGSIRLANCLSMLHSDQAYKRERVIENSYGDPHTYRIQPAASCNLWSEALLDKVLDCCLSNLWKTELCCQARFFTINSAWFFLIDVPDHSTTILCTQTLQYMIHPHNR